MGGPIRASGRKLLRAAAAGLCLAAVAALAGCVRPGDGLGNTAGDGMFRPVSFAALPGWQADDAAAALAAFVRGCKVIDRMPVDQHLGGTGQAAARAGQAGLWRAACANGEAVPPGDQAAARAFFQANFDPWRIAGAATITGYFEPVVDGAKNRAPGYTVPLYAKPAVPALADLSRREIDGGALARKTPVTAWLADPVDAYMLQSQGAGTVRLPDGQVLRVGFDGQSDQPYVPIGQILEQHGALAAGQLSFQSIDSWLKSHPGQARALMEENPRYVYLKPLGGIPADLGTPGSLGVPKTPGRTLAVNAADIPLGTPVFLQTTDPQTGGALDRLTFAQDTGGGIKGAKAADLFFGDGAGAESIAGVMHESGYLYILLPKASAAREGPTS